MPDESSLSFAAAFRLIGHSSCDLHESSSPYSLLMMLEWLPRNVCRASTMSYCGHTTRSPPCGLTSVRRCAAYVSPSKVAPVHQHASEPIVVAVEAGSQISAKLQEYLISPSKLPYLIKFNTFFAWNHMFISVQFTFFQAQSIKQVLHGLPCRLPSVLSP